jgi:hypothetical protein
VVAERVVSVELDPETLWRARCERKEVSDGSKFGLIGRGYLDRLCVLNDRDQLCFGQTEGCTRPPALSGAVTAARGGSVIGAVVVIAGIGVIAGSHCVHRVASGGAVAMHRAGNDRSGGPAQCRDPRPQKSDEQIDGAETAYHRHQSTACDSGRNTGEKSRHDQNQKCKAQLDGCRTSKMS